MTPETVLQLGRNALEMALILAGPVLVFGLVAGLVVAIFQALTQIHEMTLTFIPKIGATPLGYRIAEQFGLPVVPPKPALVPLAAAPEWLAQFGSLSGASFETIASCAGQGFRESALITHRGLSGPVILQISSYWQQAGGRNAVELDLLPGRDAADWLMARSE